MNIISIYYISFNLFSESSMTIRISGIDWPIGDPNNYHCRCIDQDNI